jgi:hypothetical protein
MAFASQHGLDAELLGKWFTEENGKFSPPSENNEGKCPSNRFKIAWLLRKKDIKRVKMCF